MKRVALYGGSFDPFHICHQLVIPYTLSIANVKQVIIAPCHTHPFEKNMAPFNHRLNMIGRGIQIFAPGSCYGSTIEEEIAAEKGTNYTFYTVEKLLKEHDTVVLVLGSDIAKDLHRWTYIDKLKELEKQGRLEFFFINRNGFTLDNGSRVQMPNVSSTEVKAAIKAGLSIGEMVPTSVAEYIKEKNLYL